MGSNKKFPNYIHKQIEDIDRRINVFKDDFVTFLLGPGKPIEELKFRIAAKEELERKGYTIIVMELENDFEADESEKTYYQDKFWKLVHMYQPKLYVCILSENGKPNAVEFEVGLISGKFGRNKASDLIHFCISDKLDIDSMVTVYVTEMLSKFNSYYYSEGDLHNLVYVIENIIQAAIRESFD